MLKEQPQNAELISVLALTNMGLGDKPAALALAEQAMAARPAEKDVVNGPFALEILARVAAQTGEADRAIAALQKLLSTPYFGAFTTTPLTPALLRLDPMFDSLRNDPRFEKLAAPAWAGDKELALQQLETGLRAPNPALMLSYGALKLHPFWDPFRGDPRFEKIVQSLAPKERH